MSYWLNPDDPSHDPVDLNFLQGPSGHYTATYTSHFPDHFLESDNHQPVLQRLTRALSISANQWLRGVSPKHDLNVLTSLPRIALLPQAHLGMGRQSSPLLLVPCKNTSVDALNALAHICHGSLEGNPAPRNSTADTASTPSVRLNAEAAATRAIFFVYLSFNQSMFTDLVDHASIVALPDKAMAAIRVISSIASASWAPLRTENHFSETDAPQHTTSLPSEDKLATMCSEMVQPLPQTGIELLTQSPAREAVFPFLLRPAQTFTHLVGGRGDPESNAYKIATAKWDCLLLVQRKLGKLIDEGGANEQFRLLSSAIDERVQEGVWGQQVQAGGQVASLEL